MNSEEKVAQILCGDLEKLKKKNLSKVKCKVGEILQAITDQKRW